MVGHTPHPLLRKQNGVKLKKCKLANILLLDPILSHTRRGQSCKNVSGMCSFHGYNTVGSRAPVPSNCHGDQNKRNDLVRKLEKCAKNKLSSRRYVV